MCSFAALHRQCAGDARQSPEINSLHNFGLANSTSTRPKGASQDISLRRCAIGVTQSS